MKSLSMRDDLMIQLLPVTQNVIVESEDIRSTPKSLMALPLCLGADSTCLYLGGIVAIGYQCIASTCLPCPVGTYGTDGSSCLECPTLTWSPTSGSSACSNTFTYSSPGNHTFRIPQGVTAISVKLWGGENDGSYIYDSGDNRRLAFGDMGEFHSCNLPVTSGQNLYAIVGSGSGLVNLNADNVEGERGL